MEMFFPPPAFQRITADARIFQGPCYLAGLLFLVTADPGTVNVYDGLDATSGRLFHTFTVHATGSDEFVGFPPVHFDQGIFIDLTGNISELTVLYIPDPPERPGMDTKLKMAGY